MCYKIMPPLAEHGTIYCSYGAKGSRVMLRRSNMFIEIQIIEKNLAPEERHVVL